MMAKTRSPEAFMPTYYPSELAEFRMTMGTFIKRERPRRYEKRAGSNRACSFATERFLTCPCAGWNDPCRGPFGRKRLCQDQERVCTIPRTPASNLPHSDMPVKPCNTAYFKSAMATPKMPAMIVMTQYRMVTLYEGQPMTSKW